jgi:hypothetical protein
VLTYELILALIIIIIIITLLAEMLPINCYCDGDCLMHWSFKCYYDLFIDWVPLTW